jgi:signal transduction histidine kinase
VIISPDGQIALNWGPISSNSVTQLVEESFESEAGGVAFPGAMISTTISEDNLDTKYVTILAPIFFEGGVAGFSLVGTPIDPSHQLPRLLVSLILGVMITLGIALAGGFWLADRAMRPVKMITHAAQTISETDLNLRLHLDRKDELGVLANTFDEMLTRLQSAFDRQRQFTADASHELRTPLTIVDLEARRALATQRTTKEYQGALNVIQSENQFMIRLVNNLLTLARMDAGQVVLKKEELDLSDVALEVVERLAPLTVGEQIRLSAGDLPELPIHGDRQYLVQMLTNLVENAIKYSRGEERRVQVTTGWRTTKNGRQAWVHVIDNGPGIPPDHLPHLFDRFYQVDKARTRQDNAPADENDQAPSGTGLGLSIAQWIAHVHGGEITVQSELGKGSTFEVSLPLANSTSDSSRPV